MRKYTIIIVATIALLILACGDKNGTDSGADTSTSNTSDAGDVSDTGNVSDAGE